MPSLSLQKLMMECTYVYFKSDMKNICVRQNIHLFLTFISTLHRPKFCEALIYNRLGAHIFVLDDNYRETKLNLTHAMKISLMYYSLYNMSEKILINKNMSLIIYNYGHRSDLYTAELIIFMKIIRKKQTGYCNIKT